MPKFFRPLLAVSIGLALAGCSLAPTYERPTPAVAASFTPADAGVEGPVAALTPWREFFTDPVLQELIADALTNNPDVRTAALRVEEARAQYGIQRSERLPHLSLEASGSRSRTPGDVNGTGTSLVSEQYQAGLGVPSFELDLFGRVKSLSDAAWADYEATNEARLAAEISLVGEVARAYLNERALAARLALAKETERAREESLSLVRQRFDADIASALAVKDAETLLYSARIDVQTLSRQRAQAFNALTVLIGKPIAALPETASNLMVVKATRLPAGLPSDLLTRRPDVLAAEASLKAANANIGAARAAFFPSISLTGFAGSASGELSGLFDGGSKSWQFTPSLSLPIFDFGRNSANLDLAQVRKSQAVVSYEKTVQAAFRDVADALVAADTLQREQASHDALTRAEGERLALSKQRFAQGIAGYLDVLDAERSYFSARQAQVDSERALIANAVSLYQALGGGFPLTTGTLSPDALTQTATTTESPANPG